MKKISSLSIVFPVHNERKTIEPVLKEWEKELKKMRLHHEFVVCEDGSNDGTTQFLKKIQKKYRLTLSQVSFRRGYGKAVLDGIRLAKNNWILCVDSDGQCDPKDLTSFLKDTRKTDVRMGWRTTRSDHPQRLLFSWAFHQVFRLMFPHTIHDPSAPYVLFEKKLAMKKLFPYLSYLKEGFWWGFVGACVKKNITIVELPIHHRERFAGDTQVYTPKKLPGIAIRNILGLVRLKLAA
jgi:glycosyltransferase involved in cell wall biosynthesis